MWQDPNALRGRRTRTPTDSEEERSSHIRRLSRILFQFSFTYLDVLLGVFQVLEKGIIVPSDTRLFVGGRVRVPVGLSGLTAKETVEVRSLLVRTTFFDSVALTALGLENLGSLLFTHGQ